MKTKNMTKLFAGISMIAAAQIALAGNITDINVSTLPDSQKIIKIHFDRDMINPRSSFKMGSLIGHSSGESFQLAFHGPGFVMVQPSEGQPVMTSS